MTPFRSVRERDLARRDGLFVAEGEVVVRALLSRRSRFRARALLILDGPAGLRLAASAGPGVPVFVADRAVMDAVAGFPIHRGILAVAERGDPVPPAAVLPAAGPALVVVLCGLTNHDNVGGCFRNAAAFGADAVLLDRDTCDPLYRKAIRVSVGAALQVPFARLEPGLDVVDALRAAGLEPVALSPAGAEPCHALPWPARTALLLGPEGAGLPPAVLARCRTARIAMRAGFDSLNVATAAGIALHAVRTARDPQPCRD